MKHLKLIFACLLMAVLSIGQVWAVDYDLVYTLDGTISGGNSNYDQTGSGCSQNDITWMVVGNTTTSPWRIGGKSLNGVDRTFTAGSTIAANIAKIEIESGIVSGVTVNSLKVEVASDAEFTSIVSTITPEFVASSTAVVERPSDKDWTGKYYRITYNVTNTTTSNKYVQFKSAKFYKEKSASDPVLESITITGDLDNKSYEVGQSIDFSGLTATGNYDDESTEDLTDDVEWSFTPALTVGLTSVTVTATLDEISGNKVISGLTVAEHVVTPGTYSIPMTNTLWGTSYSGTASGATEVSGTSNDVSITLTKGGSTNMYVSDTETRAYGSYSLVISVPTGYVITAMTFTKGSNWNCSTETGTLSGQSWTGSANSVAFSFGGRTDFKAVSVTYEAYVAPTTYAVSFAAPEHGTLAIANGLTPIATGDEFSAGTELTVSTEPASGYILEAIKVIETGSDPENDVTSTVLSGTTLTVPAHAITVSATFVENVAPAVTSYVLSEIGVETSLLEDQHVGDVVTLPSTATECSKTFVGWSEDASCAVAPEYAPGAEYTLKANNKLYAVYADAEGVEGSFDITATTANVPTSYGTANTFSEYTLGGIKFQIQQMYKSGGKLQWRAGGNSSGSGTIYNSDALSNLQSIVLEYNSSDTGKNFGLKVGSSANPTSGTEISQSLSESTGTFDCSAGAYDYFVLTNGSGAGYLDKITITYYSSFSYSNYSTTCAAAPSATPATASIEVVAAGASSTLGVTYENVNLAGVTVALFNNEACTEPFDGGWLTATIDGEDKHIAYTAQENTSYNNVRTAYIKLTAPQTSGVTDPAVVVIPVEQARKPAVFANLADLVAANVNSGIEVTVTFANEVITGDQTISGTKRAGVMLTTKAANDVEIEIFYNKGTTVVPAGWLIGGKLSATSMTFTWTLYNSQWELVPLGNDWTWDNGDLTYVAPKAVSSVVVSGAPSKTSYVDGEKFNPDGLTVTVNYNDETSEVNPVGVTFALDPERLAIGNTSVEVVATYNTISSEAFEVTGLTVGEIQLKTVQEFITAGNADMRCYLEGVVSNIETGGKLKYGNFNLTDASGTIYVYGCLTSEGVAEQFGTLDVANGDKIKVLAEDYEYYNSKHEAKNVVFVSNKKAATMTFDALEMEVGDVEMMAPATITLAEASAVAYSIKAGSDACVTLDGTQITATAEGSAIIVATLAETSLYMGTTVEFAVTVTEADTRKIATGSAFTAIKGDLTPNDITFAAHKGEGTTEPIVKDENIRLYKPASGKNTGGYLTITALPGCKIDQVQITFGGNATAAYCKDDAALPTAAFITSKKELLTSAELDAQSVSIVNLKDGSIDISAIKVWYIGEPLPLPEISYSPSIQSIQVGGAWSAPTLNNPNGVTIASYASDNEEVATVTPAGVISLVENATGTAHITAHFAGDESYREADAVYTIIVLSEIDALLTNSKWIRVDNAAALRPEMQVIVAQYGEGDVKVMGAQNSNNRAAVSATVEGNVLSPVPSVGTQILTLVDAGEGKFSFLTTTGYLHAASSSSNNLKEEAERDDNADWEISISKGVATIIAQGNYTRNWMRFNSENNLFSCYASGQTDIALYVKADDYNRDVTAGRYGTICLPKGGVMEGATLYEVAYFDGAASKIFFDEIVNGAMEPGMPYIFLSNAPASKLGVIYSDEEPAVSAKNNNGLYGSFTQELLAKDAGNYILLNNQYLFVNSDEVYVGANRAYIRLEDVPTTATPLAPGRRRISMGVANEQVATGIDNLNADEAPMKMMIDGQLFILRGEKLYDATGRLVK